MCQLLSIQEMDKKKETKDYEEEFSIDFKIEKSEYPKVREAILEFSETGVVENKRELADFFYDIEDLHKEEMSSNDWANYQEVIDLIIIYHWDDIEKEVGLNLKKISNHIDEVLLELSKDDLEDMLKSDDPDVIKLAKNAIDNPSWVRRGTIL